MLTDVVPRWPVKVINVSFIHRHGDTRERFPRLRSIRFPRAVCSPWESGGLHISIWATGYTIEEARGPQHIARAMLNINRLECVCLCCDNTDASSHPLVLPDSRVPYVQLVPRCRKACSVAKNRD